MRLSRLLASATVIAVLASLPLWAQQGIVFLVGLTLTEALFALSWNLLFGYTGLANFGAAGFYTIGAYAVGVVLRYNWPMPFVLDLVIAGLLGGLTALIVGAIVLRRMTGINLAVLTLSLAEILKLFIGHSDQLGRDDGLAGIPRPTLSLGPLAIDLSSTSAYYWFLLLACSVMALLLWWVVNSQIGRVLRSIRLDATRAAFVGIDVHFYRLLAFTISGSVGAVAGGLAAPWTQLVSPDAASWLHSAQPMLNTLLGGTGFFWGPVAGAFAYAAIEYFTRTLAGLSDLVVGFILLVVILVAPAGLIGLARMLLRRAARLPRPGRP